MPTTIRELLESKLINSALSTKYSLKRNDIEYCLMHIIGKTREFLISNSHYTLSLKEEKDFFASLKLLRNGMPLAYVIGNQEFYGYTYIVDKNVLIPRPETEIIIPKILEYGDSIFKKKQGLTLIDAGSGSGCIGLTIASERPDWNVILIEKSLKAISVLEKNFHSGLYKNCSILATNWLKGFCDNKADIIVSNPPYIKHNCRFMDEIVYKYEPHSALFSRDDGLKDIKILISESKRALVKDGFLIIENGFDQSDDIIRFLKENYFEDIDIILDYNGIKRFTVSRNSGYGQKNNT